MLRCFPDSGVLIAAARSTGRDAERALGILDDPQRVFLTSPFVYLEVVPKAKYFNRRLELAFYNRFFRSAIWCRQTQRIVAAAQQEASRSGLAAMDALHVVAAHLLRADEFITTETPTKPVYRTSLVRAVYLFA